MMAEQENTEEQTREILALVEELNEVCTEHMLSIVMSALIVLVAKGIVDADHVHEDLGLFVKQLSERLLLIEQEQQRPEPKQLETIQ
jgi:hypothetical protein